MWREIEPVERHGEWMTDAVEVRFRTPQRRGVGTDYDCVTRVGPFRTVDHMTCVEWDEGVAMGIVHRGTVAGHGRFVLESIDDTHTRFCWDESLKFPWWMGGPIGERAARPLLTRVWRANLGRLAARF